MVKVLSRDAVQRMTGRRSSSAVNIGGGGGDASGVSRAWVEENYVSKAFFETLFTIHGTKEEDGVTTDVVITPNDTETTLKNIQAMVGLWTNSYLSALGLNPGGGGGGGGIDMATVWSALAGNTTEQINKSHLTTALAGYATQSWVSNNYLPLTGGTMSNTTLVANLNADMLDGRHGDGYVTIETEQTVSGNKTFSGTITPTGGIVPRATGSVNTHNAADNSKLVIKQTSAAVDETPNNGLVLEWGTSGNWVGQLYFGDNGTQGLYWGGWTYQNNVLTRNEWVKLAFVTDNVASATKLQTARTIWGQNFDGTNNVSGLINNVAGIKLNQTGNGYGYIDFHYASSSAYTSNIYEKSSGLLVINNILNIIKDGNIGIGTASPSYKLHVNGTFHASGNSSIGGTLGVTGAATFSSTLGVTGLLTANGGINIPIGKTLTMGDTALVTNLNADMLDGRHGDGYAVIGVMGTRIEQEADLNDILNAGTYTCISGADALTLDNTPYTGGNFRLWHIVNTGTDGNTGQQWSSQIMLAPNEAKMFIRSHGGSSFGEWKEFAYLTSNVASATKLQTARTIWGQSFDGTGNVSGDITDAGNIFAKGDYLLLSSGKSKYGLMVESTSWGENRDCAFGFHAATSGHDIAWSTRSGNNDICLDLVIDPNNTVAKRYTRVYDALCIGDGMIIWDSANNALKVIKINGDAANFYATGGVSALGSST